MGIEYRLLQERVIVPQVSYKESNALGQVADSLEGRNLRDWRIPCLHPLHFILSAWLLPILKVMARDVHP